MSEAAPPARTNPAAVLAAEPPRRKASVPGTSVPRSTGRSGATTTSSRRSPRATSRGWADELTSWQDTRVELNETITIGRPPQAVFDAWARVDLAAQHHPAVLEHTPLTAGPIGVGTRFGAVDHWPGRDVRYTVEITAFVRPERIAAVWSDPLSGGWDAIFEPVPGGTELRFHATANPSGVRNLPLRLLLRWYRAAGACLPAGLPREPGGRAELAEVVRFTEGQPAGGHEDWHDDTAGRPLRVVWSVPWGKYHVGTHTDPQAHPRRALPARTHARPAGKLAETP